MKDFKTKRHKVKRYMGWIGSDDNPYDCPIAKKKSDYLQFEPLKPTITFVGKPGQTLESLKEEVGK